MQYKNPDTGLIWNPCNTHLISYKLVKSVATMIVGW
jgi:hypothetical protein